MPSKGSILIIVLWLLFFLGALALAINRYVFSQLSLAQRLQNRSKAYYLAKAALNKALICVRQNEDEQYDALNSPWAIAKQVDLAGGYFKYEASDEERRVNINTAEQWLLNSLLRSACGIDERAANEISSAILKRRAAYGFFEMKEELLLVEGVTQGLFSCIQGKVTLHSSGLINMNTADASSLGILGIESSLAAKIDSFRKGPDAVSGTSDDNVFISTGMIASSLGDSVKLSAAEYRQLSDALSSGLISVRSLNFSVKASGYYGRSSPPAVINAVFSRDEEIKYWREE